MSREGELTYPNLLRNAWTSDKPVPLSTKQHNRELEKEMAEARTEVLERARARAEAARAKREGRVPRVERRRGAGASSSSARPPPPVELEAISFDEWNDAVDCDAVLASLVDDVVADADAEEDVEGVLASLVNDIVAEEEEEEEEDYDLTDDSTELAALSYVDGVSTRLYCPTWMRPSRLYAFDATGRRIPPRRLNGMLHERAQRLRARNVRRVWPHSSVLKSTLASLRQRHDWVEPEEEEEEEEEEA
ncbi:hypothetical protein PPROV_000579700 [Pycnococcus provasolii]|uniref:Uncharacterized protein n=1 Tax=Pycnococcus provasolii TaxID=41880 RepID=A0A830HIU8_9CHLO|nr:hypothetical protein PPROV_000579700 [Pycnococcus provasolii]